DPEEATAVARVAVRIPAARVDDTEGFEEVVLAVEEAEDDQAVVGHHVAVAGVVIVPVLRRQKLPRPAPITCLSRPLTDLADHARNGGVLRDEREADLNQGM